MFYAIKDIKEEVMVFQHLYIVILLVTKFNKRDILVYILLKVNIEFGLQGTCNIIGLD